MKSEYADAIPSGRAWCFKVSFYPQNPRLLALGDKRPPSHFHPYQAEFFEVVAGSITVEIDGKPIKRTPSSGEFTVHPWVNHRIYPTPNTDEKEVVLLVSATATEGTGGTEMDSVFFENWYRYQDQALSGGESVDVWMREQMWDAGGSYMSLPWWIPFGKYISVYFLGIFVGRWIGGLLGYRPFLKEWTTDWDVACKKMRENVFQRRFAKP
ncbi:hypothetical protein EDC01DRAFT_641472 [Geopyxis carbonaria]|nr:hypothetical protein EDC01DRAFT_641472 [Geopyxis carbonaria]